MFYKSNSIFSTVICSITNMYSITVFQISSFDISFSIRKNRVTVFNFEYKQK